MKSFVFILLHSVLPMMEGSNIDLEITATNIFHFGANNSTKVAQPRIIGGNTADEGKYPFFAQWSGCGASLIHGDILLTAAHCAALSSNSVIIGPHIYGYADGVLAQSRQVVQRVSHPSNNPSTIAFDFMVLKLNYPITNVDPVKLNSDPVIPGSNEDEYIAIGFGATTQDGQSSNSLQDVSVQYITHDLCNSKEMYNGKIEASNMLCAAGVGKDSCQGDSGESNLRFVLSSPNVWRLKHFDSLF
jgi:secreted trypsin-like serine protease